MLSMALVAVSLLAPSAHYVEPVEIRLLAPKRQVLVGEPVRVAATWIASESVLVMTHRARVFLDRGVGFVRWSESQRLISDMMESGETITPEHPGFSMHVIGVGNGRTLSQPNALSVLAFASPGTYRVRLEYGYGEAIVRSNTVSISVVSPTGTDRELFEKYIRPHPEVMSAEAGPYERVVDRMFEEFDASPYLARPFVVVMERKIRRALRAAPRGRPVQGEVPELLDRLAKRELGDSPFDEDRQILLAEMMDRSGRAEEARSKWQEILARYPIGVGARKARLRLVTAQRGEQGVGPGN